MPADPQALARLPLLGPVAGRLADRNLWRLRRGTVAWGVAVGAFFAFAIPFAQIPLSVLCALVLRCNVPTAVAATFVNTPLTFGPVYYAAYLVGAWLIGGAPTTSADEVGAAVSAGWSVLAGDAALALLTGAFVFASVAAVAGYLLVHAVWSVRARRRAARWVQLRAAGD